MKVAVYLKSLVFLSFSTLVTVNQGVSAPVAKKLVKENIVVDLSLKEETKVNEIKRILKDPKAQISNKFNIPAGLYDRVLFWSRVYAELPSTTVLIHDRRDLSIIYSTLEVKTPEDTKNLNTIVKGLTDALTNLSAITPASLKLIKAEDEYEKMVLDQWKPRLNNPKHAELFLTAAKFVRTQSGQRDIMVQAIKSSSLYITEFKSIFREYDLPEELVKLPFVESSFNAKAVSKVGAGGLWQLMNYTGTDELKIAEHIDERFSPAKAAHVAAKLLKSNYEKLGTWPLAVTAYNHGAGGVARAVKETGSENIDTIVNNYVNPRFGFASQNFYSEFLAALYVTTYYEELFGSVKKMDHMLFEQLVVKKSQTITEIAKSRRLSVDTIASYNPELSQKVINGETKIEKDSVLKLPYKAIEFDKLYY
jgi:membrane-bound lytic murein transglycosylase D